MEELLIEEKAKRYDEAIERYKAKQEYESQKVREYIEYLFHELKESEDERIRKALLEMVHDTTGDSLWVDYNVHKEDAIDWLEKQGEHANFRNKIQIGDKVTRNEDGVLVNLSQLNRVAKKQGEQKPYASETMNEKGDFDNGFTRMMEKEQKPADKFEPKFKVGDWVILTAGELSTMLQIVKVDTDKKLYWFNDSSYLPIVDEECLHLWTIKDAKAGDVLADDRVILLFRSIGNRNWKDAISYYAILETNLNNRFSISDDEEYWGKVEDCELKPASEEQRDLLFQKMKEAGYEWDADKKELKKIEQKPDKNKGMNLVEEEMTPFQKEVFCIIDTTIEEEQGLKQVCDKLFALASNEIKQKFSWSEEDKDYYDAIIAKLEVTQDDALLTDNQIEFLKSLKDRYIWKPSDEQINTLEYYMHTLVCNEHKEILFGLYSCLKKLREE